MDKLAQFAKQSPSQICIDTGTNQLTYQDVHREISKLVRYFSIVLPNQRVGLCLKDPLEFIFCFWACLRLGKDVYLFNWRYGSFNTSLLSSFNLKDVVDTFPSINDEGDVDTGVEHDCFDKSTIRVFSSGTTGDPKCVRGWLEYDAVCSEYAVG